ncbi:hypothetical protein LCGC14_2053410 [marine sediment metagenome]|uniref:Uncharacterized protein n=1 Tax=marine sediment metagenome TaxID=412755 RepID=A0A0F9ENA6_9ZZZZ
MAELPEGVYEKGGQLYRDVARTSPDGEECVQHRLVALTFGEAKLKHFDYFHPKFGWILEGYKLAKDRDVDDILADASEVVIATPEQQEQLALAETEGA